MRVTLSFRKVNTWFVFVQEEDLVHMICFINQYDRFNLCCPILHINFVKFLSLKDFFDIHKLVTGKYMIFSMIFFWKLHNMF